MRHWNSISSNCKFGGADSTSILNEAKNINMEINKKDTAVEKTAVKDTREMQEIRTDISIGMAIADHMSKRKDDPEGITKPSSEPEVTQVLHIRDYKKDAAVSKELRDKLNSLLKENSSSLQERSLLLRDLVPCIERERKRRDHHEVVTLNRQRGKLKRIWAGRGLPVDENTLQLATNPDVFDLSSLNESLPCTPDDSDISNLMEPLPSPRADSPALRKAEKLAKDYVSFMEYKRRSFRKSEILRILGSQVPEQKINSSTKQSRSITRMVKKVCGDVNNVRLFSFRPLVKKDSNPCGASKGFSCPELRQLHASPQGKKSESVQESNGQNRLQKGPSQTGYKWGREMVVLLKSPLIGSAKTRSDKRRGAANHLRNPERLLFNREQRDDERQRSASARKQQLHDSFSLIRKMSRLNIANSRRGDLSEDLETQEASSYQNDDQQEKVSIANRRREVLHRLRETYTRYKNHETEALKKN